MLVSEFIAFVEERCPSDKAEIFFQGQDYQYPAMFVPSEQTSWVSGRDQGKDYSFFIIKLTESPECDLACKRSDHRSE